MKKAILAIAFVLLSGVLPAQNHRDWHRPDTRIPYRMVKGKMIVDVEIGGRVRPFLFDTGASRSGITDSLYAALGVGDEERKAITLRDSGGQSASHSVVRIDSLLWGDWVITGHLVPVISASAPIMACYGLDGIIGSDILQKKVVHIVARDSVILLVDRINRLPEKPQHPTRIFLSGTLPHIKITGGNGDKKGSHWTLVDTGEQGYICRLDGHLPYMERQGVIEQLERGYGSGSIGLLGMEPPVEQVRGIVPELWVGGVRLEQVPVSSGQSGSSLLGTFLLKCGDMTIDYRKKRFYYTPFVEERRMEARRWQVSIMFTDNEMVIGVVWSEELKPLIQAGDRVISVNGRPSGEFPLCTTLVGGFGLDPKEPIVLTVETLSGDLVDVTLNKE